MNRYETIVRHTVAWILYAVYFYIVNKLGNSQLSILTVLVSLPFFILIYYGVSYSLNVHLYHKRYLRAILTVFLVYGITFLGVYLSTHGWAARAALYSDYLSPSSSFNFQQLTQSFLLLVGNFSFFAFLGYQYRLKLVAIKKKQEERTKRERYEYTMLAEQVSPHLLANVFQLLEHQLKDLRLDAKDQVFELYNLMLYFMNSSRADGPASVLLADEIQATRRFIAIYERLAEQESAFQWEITGNTLGATIPATGLVTLVSNVFKHGDPFNPCYPPTVQVSVDRNGYTLVVCNKVTPREKTQTSHGLGIDNLRRRLDYVFGDKFKLNNVLDGENYKVHLTVYF